MALVLHLKGLSIISTEERLASGRRSSRSQTDWKGGGPAQPACHGSVLCGNMAFICLCSSEECFLWMKKKVKFCFIFHVCQRTAMELEWSCSWPPGKLSRNSAKLFVKWLLASLPPLSHSRWVLILSYNCVSQVFAYMCTHSLSQPT